MKKIDLKITNVIRLIPIFNYNKDVTNKRRYYKINLNILCFELSIILTKNNKK